MQNKLIKYKNLKYFADVCNNFKNHRTEDICISSSVTTCKLQVITTGTAAKQHKYYSARKLGEIE